MVDKTPHEAMPGSASGLGNYEIMLLARTSPPIVDSIKATSFFGPNNDQAATGDHGHVVADYVRAGFMSTGDRAKLNALSTERMLPFGGSAGQIMQKVDGTDYNIVWANAPVGGGGGGGWVQQNTQTALAQTNPTMALGAIGWETDTGRWKIGDGITTWNSLAYTDMARTPAAITNPGTTASFRFRTHATQVITFTSAPAGTVTIQAPTSAPPASHEGEMYLRLTNNSGSTVTVAATAFQVDGDYLVSSIPTATTQEYTLWVLGGVWYISGGQDLEENSVSNSQLAQVTQNRIKGRYTAGTGNVEDLSPNQVRWLINNAQPNIVNVAVNTTVTKALHQGKSLVCSATLNLTVDTLTDFDQHYESTILAEGGAVTIIATATVHAPSGLIIPQYARAILRRETGTDIYTLDITSHPKVAGANSVAATTASGTTTLALSGDTASPGVSKYYGTNAGSTRGFYDLPTGGGGGATALGGLTDVADVLAPSNNNVLQYSSGTGLWQAGTVTIPGGSGTVVDNIAALQGIASPVDGEFVFVRGYTTILDGGGGLFQWDSSFIDYKMVTGITVNAGGTGYTVGQLCWVVGGTPTYLQETTLLKVAAVSGNVVTGVTLISRGAYSVAPTTTGCATGTSKVGATGLTINLTIVSWTDSGTTFPKTAGGVGRWRRRYEGNLNVKWFGAKGDGSTDDTTAIQEAIDTYGTIFFPQGNYRITRALTYWQGQTVCLEGAGALYGWNTATIFDARGADVEEPMFHHFGRWMKQDGTYFYEEGYSFEQYNLAAGGAVRLENIRFLSTDSKYGACVEITMADDIHIEYCCFEATFRGLTLGAVCFDKAIINCRFTSNFMLYFPWEGTTGGESNKIIAARAWGLYVSGHSTALNNAIVGYGCGYRCVGVENSLIGARIEVNHIGILMANKEYTFAGYVDSYSTKSTIQSVHLEACTIALRVDYMDMCDIRTLGIQGSPAYAERPRSEIGILIYNMSERCTISDINANGDFKSYGFLNFSVRPLWKSNAGGDRPYGALNTPFLDNNIPTAFLNSFLPSIGYLTFFNTQRHAHLTGLDLRNNNPIAKNFGGTVTVAQGATTSAVTFQEAIGIGNIAINTIDAIADGASTLPANTYYYATTTVSKHAEVGLNYDNANGHNHRTISVPAGNRVDMTFYGGSDTSRYVRRIYRGTYPWNFDGYWQITMGASFSDTGQAFTSTGMPPANGSIPSTAEDDTNYRIIATADGWNSGAIWITSKTTTGFTINCATAPGAGGGVINWLMYRA